VIPISTQPLRYRNELRIVLRDGTVLAPYAKHHPTIGEPTIAGTDPARAIDRPWGRIGAAICYDYDFPSIGRALAGAGADVVAVPSSDWRGIDPVHAQMAMLRSIESGHALVRSTRWGSSIAVDGYGRVRAWQSSYEPTHGIMSAALPRSRVGTLYAWWGDLPVGVAAAFIVGLAGNVLVRTRRRLAPAAAVT
jgi:apolipoprotein N-acyltransferase